MLHRSVSEPSLGTVCASIGTSATSRASHSHHTLHRIRQRVEKPTGAWLFEGRIGKVTRCILLAPWHFWFRFDITAISVIVSPNSSVEAYYLHVMVWQVVLLDTTNGHSPLLLIYTYIKGVEVVVLVSIVYKYLVAFIITYYLDEPVIFLNATINISETIFMCDVLINLLHAYWPLVRLHMRARRRNVLFLTYDIVSVLPLTIVFQYQQGYETLVTIGRWFGIGRIYRIFLAFREVNENMRTSRKMLYVIEHTITMALVLHGSACVWYATHKSSNSVHKWWNLGYPPHVNAKRLTFNSYKTCWYYCACRFFNVIFGDSFPVQGREKILTSCLMLVGYVFFRYRFIGSIAWELVMENNRRSEFIDRYHHMVSYLKLRGTPVWLVEQAKQYKKMLWRMKDGVLSSKHLQNLPGSLQMELIFDINVGHFHSTLLFRDTEEAFMRQISLLMRHELFLTGQHIWSQGVVKSGMICIKRGVIEMLSDEDDESPMIAFKEGTVLGELSLFYSIPSKVTVKAATYVELQVLRRTDFMRVMAEHPFTLEHIRKKIGTRMKKSRTRQEGIMQYDKDDSRLIRTRYRPMKVLKDNLAGVEEEDPTFVDDSHMYYKDENNERHPKFTPEFLELYEMTNNVTTVDAPRICLRSTFPWILEPYTDFTHLFDAGHFIMVIYLCIMSPQFAIQNSLSDTERVLNTIVMAGLLLNIYTQLTTAIIEKTVRKMTVKEIAEVKMASPGFYLDIISVFPVYIFTDTLDPQGETMAGQVAKLFPMLQVWHIWDYIGIWEKRFSANSKFLSVLKFSTIIMICCYWSGCFLYLYACPKKLCREDSWMSQLIYWETKVFMTSDAKHERPMTTALIFGTSVFTNSGLADLSPGSNDLFVVAIILIIGSYMGCFYTAKICSIYLLSTQRKQKFKESMKELFYFLSVNHVSGKIKARVKKFFCVQWYYNNAVSTQEIFMDVSANIKQEILCIEMVETLLYCPLFQECNRDFLQTVAANTRTLVLPDNEIVQHAADIGRDMYILQKGHCNLLNHHGKVVKSIGPGSHFGVIEMLFGLPKVYTILTSTNCILLHVEYTSLVQCWGTFPDISHSIIKVLADAEVYSKAKEYEEAKPLTGRLDVKTNRIAQEIKESFVMLSGREERVQFVKTFDRLGVMRHLKYIFLPGCITPHGIFLKLWCAIRFMMAVYYIIVVPYAISTKQHKFGSSYNLIDIVLYVDVVVMSYVAYYNDRSLLVTHPLLTLSRYLQHAFFLDIISIFPFEQLVRIVNESTDLDVYRINRILLVTRITGAFSYWESDIMRVNPAVVLLKFLPIALMLVNVATAFVFMNSCKSYMPLNSNTLMVNCSRALIVNGATFELKQAVTEYIYALYWVFEIFVGLGCTPVNVTNKIDVWLITALQICGFLYFAFMFGYVASTRSTASNALLEHTEKTKDLANFLYQENVDPILTAKTLKYFEYVWKRTNGSNPQQICRRLNSALMEDTLVFMYERALREVPLFGKVERSFIRVITQHLSEMYFLKGDTVIQCRDVQANIFIIYKGKVDVLTSYNEMITCMGPGGMFGNFSGQSISCSEVTIFASRSLDLLVIPSHTFFNLVKYYPKIQEPLYKAFETSTNYILPITMAVIENSSSEESEVDAYSLDSAFDSKSESSRYETSGIMSLRSSHSHSNVSSAKSSTSAGTYQSYTQISNLLKPGTMLFQGFGYVTCVMATANYGVALYEIVTMNDCFVIFWLQAIFDIYFYMKTYFNLHQGYISKHGEFVLDAVKCRRRYYKHKLWVWTDLLVNIPIELFAFCFPNPVPIMHYLRANKLFRLKYLYEFYHKTSAELTNNQTTLQTVMTAIAVILFIHTFACIWLLALVAITPFSLIRTLKTHLMDEETIQRRWDYISSLYVVISELTTTGGDEFLIDEIFPMAILVLILIFSKMLGAIVVATAIQVSYSTKYALTLYEKVTNELIDMLKNQGLSSYQLDKFWKYVRQLWVTERGRQLPALLEHTPYVRRCDLMTAMFGQHLRNCYLFADTGEAFLRQLTVCLDYTIFFPGNYIVVAGDSEARMYWIASGTVSVLSVRSDLTETTHELLGPGDVFGILQGLNRGIRHCFSYRAETKVNILTLSQDALINILPFFPEAKKMITDRSEILFAQI